MVCDAHDASWIETARGEGAARTWDVLLLRVSPVWFERQHGDALQRLEGARVLDVAVFAGAANRDVSRFMVDVIHRLPSFDAGGRTIAEHLREANGNLWWSLEVSEKSSFRGPLVERLFRLAMVREALRAGPYDRLWIRVADPLLADAIAAASGIDDVRRFQTGEASGRTGFARAYWVSALAALARFVAVRFVLSLSGWRSAPSQRGLGIFTLFPYWWIEPFGRHPAERFFSAPPVGSHYVAWVTWPQTIWRQRAALKRTLQRAAIVPVQRFIRWRSAVGVLSVRRFRRLSRAQSAVRDHLRVRFDAADVSALVADDVTASMADGEVFFDQLVAAGVGGYLRAVHPSAIAFRVEGQPWEHALVRSSQEAGVTAVGFFHSMYGDNYPALRYAPGEVAGADHGAGKRPLADRLLVSGATVEQYVVRDGYAPSKVARCGPQRHASFVAFLRGRPSRDALRSRLGLPLEVPIYFVAIAIVEAETEGLFACLEQVLAGEPAFHLLIKTHPNRPAGDASMQAAIASIGRERVGFVPAGADMYEYMAASDTMVCIGSTVAFEAMALDVMPIVYEHPGTFSATSLRAFGDALYVVNAPASMGAAIEECRSDGPGARARRARWPETLAGVFGDVQTPLDQQLRRALADLGVPGHGVTEVTSNGIR